MVRSEFFDDFPEMRTRPNAVLKGEFAVMLLHMMDKITDNDVEMCCKVFGGMDILDNGMIAIDALRMASIDDDIESGGGDETRKWSSSVGSDSNRVSGGGKKSSAEP